MREKGRLSPFQHFGCAMLLLSEGVVNVAPVRLDAAEPALAAERHQLVGGERLVHVSVVSVVEHVTGLVSAINTALG